MFCETKTSQSESEEAKGWEAQGSSIRAFLAPLNTNTHTPLSTLLIDSDSVRSLKNSQFNENTHCTDLYHPQCASKGAVVLSCSVNSQQINHSALYSHSTHICLLLSFVYLVSTFSFLSSIPSVHLLMFVSFSFSILFHTLPRLSCLFLPFLVQYLCLFTFKPYSIPFLKSFQTY